jgi:hypothetical protein
VTSGDVTSGDVTSGRVTSGDATPPESPGDGGPADWSGRFVQQAGACADLGSPLYARLLRLLADDCVRGGATWDLVEPRAELRFGQAGALRLLGAAHRLALSGAADGWASVLPSCGGAVPDDDGDLWASWTDLVRTHGPELTAGLGREVQTNEVGRSAGLGLALARAAAERDGVRWRLVELGCSGGLNLRLDRFRIVFAGDDGPLVLGAGSSDGVEVSSSVVDGESLPPTMQLPEVSERIGLDPHPIDVATEDGALTLLSFVWPDQSARLARLRSAIEVARAVPAEIRSVSDTAGALAETLSVVPAEHAGTAVMHSVVWQYIPVEQRWRITEALEVAGEQASEERPLAWIRFEPDEWDRRRAAVWLRTWPDGRDSLVAHTDFHGRWIRPFPA